MTVSYVEKNSVAKVKFEHLKSKKTRYTIDKITFEGIKFCGQLGQVKHVKVLNKRNKRKEVSAVVTNEGLFKKAFNGNMIYPEEPAINILVLGEKNLHKRYFIESFKKILKYKTYDEYHKTECGKESDTNDTFYARYKKICFIDAAEVDPNASFLENQAVLQSIKLSIHTSGELHGIVCLLHYDPTYYENYLSLIFAHLFTKDQLPAIKDKLIFVFVDTSEILEPVHIGFGKFLEKFGTDFSSSSWKDWRIKRFKVNYEKLDEEHRNIKWSKAEWFFQEIFTYFVRDETKLQFELKSSDDSVSKVLVNFLDVLIEIAFTIENNLLASKSLGFLRRSFLKIQSYNTYVTNCPAALCSFTRIDSGEAVAIAPNSHKCVANISSDKFCNKCKYFLSKHYRTPYKIITLNPFQNEVKPYYDLEEDRTFVLKTIATIIAFGRDKLEDIFTKKIEDRIVGKHLDDDMKKQFALFHEDVTKCSVKENMSFNDISKCIDDAVGRHLISIDYRNTFLIPEKRLILSDCCRLSDNFVLNYFIEDEKDLQKNVNV